jgi:hypothetical protein
MSTIRGFTCSWARVSSGLVKPETGSAATFGKGADGTTLDVFGLTLKKAP